MGSFNREEKSGSRGGFGRRDSRRSGSGRRGGKKEMHKTVCDKCGKDCEVPFAPTEGKPVYCSECFEKKEGGFSSRRSHQGRGPRRSNFGRKSDSRPQNNEQFEEVSRKLDKVLGLLTKLSLKEEKEVVAKPLEIIILDQKKTKTTKEKSPVKKTPVKKSSVKKTKKK